VDDPGHHPLSGTKREIDGVRALFVALDTVGFKAETFLLQTGGRLRRHPTRLLDRRDGEGDTMRALVRSFNESGNSSGSSTCRVASTSWMFISDSFRASRCRSGWPAASWCS
jgi:hypothetical protein